MSTGEQVSCGQGCRCTKNAGVPVDALQLLHGPGETVGASLVAQPGIAGVARVASAAARPDPTQFDPASPYHDIPGATHVGHESCKTCHEAEFQDWLLSDHHKAMNPATEEFVLGDFNDATFVDALVSGKARNNARYAI